MVEQTGPCGEGGESMMGVFDGIFRKSAQGRKIKSIGPGPVFLFFKKD